MLYLVNKYGNQKPDVRCKASLEHNQLTPHALAFGDCTNTEKCVVFY